MKKVGVPCEFALEMLSQKYLLHKQKMMEESKLCKIIILSYAFKMRQDYLSTSYLDPKYLPGEQSEMREYGLIQVTCTEIILSHFESI